MNYLGSKSRLSITNTMANVLRALLILGFISTLYGDCPPSCICQGNKINCSDANIESLASLTLPEQTTQFSLNGNTKLTRIGSNDLSTLVNLDKLNLSGNAISTIEAGAFSGLQRLTKLDLTNNKLAIINNSMFSGLSELKRLHLSGNQFSTLPKNVFGSLQKLSKIDFDSSRLVCDCRLAWVIKWISDTEVNVGDSKCASPAELQDTLIRKLNDDNLQCDRPVRLRVFEIQPSGSQLVFGGDSLPIVCRVSTEQHARVSWFRQGRQVLTNSTTKIRVVNDTSDPALIVLTLELNQMTIERSGRWECVAETSQGNVTQSLNIVVAEAFCPERTVDTNKGKYTWRRNGYNTRSEQPCKLGKAGAKAYYSCNSQGQWVNLDMKACKYNSQVTQLLSDLSMDDFNVTTNLDMVKTLMEMLMQPAVLIADKMDVIFVARVLRKISSSYDLYSREQIPQMVCNITSLMMNVNQSLLLEAEKEEKSCTSMRDNLQTVVNYVLESKTDYSIYMDNIALQARKLPKGSFGGLTCTAYQNPKAKKAYLAGNFYCHEQPAIPDLSKNQKIEALIHVPPDVAQSVPSHSNGLFKLVVIIYRNDQLYQSATDPLVKSKYFIPSSVVSASIISANMEELSSNVMVALPRHDYIGMGEPKVQPVYWGKSESIWVNNGCQISDTVKQANHNLSVMECKRLASFSLLQKRAVPNPVVENAETFIVLGPQFYVGAVFLCICLLAVIFTYMCSYRTITLSRKLKHSLINTCFSIFLLKIIFVLGVKTQQDIPCKIVGMAIHYFSITTIFWITVTTWNIYKKINGKSHRHIPTETDGSAPIPPNPMLKFYLFAWGIPVIICGITGAVNIDFYHNAYCFVAWKPGLLAFYGVVGVFILINCILYICICSTKRGRHTKVYMDEMMVLNADGCLERQPIDDSMSNTGSVKSSVADSEYRPLAQLTGVILFLMLYVLMWTSGAFSIKLPFETHMDQVDVILSFLYMILCIILGIFLVVFYCLARNDTRSSWHSCCRTTDDPTFQPPRSSTNINVISHTNAHSSLKRDDDDSSSSVKTSSAHNQSNPLLQIMQYHKKAAMMSHSVAGSQSRGDASVHGSPDDAPVFFNPRQNGVAKRYWERKRTSRERGMNGSMMSVPETGRMQTHSPTNTEPTQHMSIEIQIKSHSSKQARRHRLGSTNSEPADVRNNIYHSMPKSPHQLNVTSSHNRRREPTIGRSKTPSDSGRDLPQFYRYPQDMWQNSMPRDYHRVDHRSSPPAAGYVRQSSMPYEHADLHRQPSVERMHKHAFTNSYAKSMKDTDNSDDESHYSHRSRRSSQRNRHRHPRHRHLHEAEGHQLTASALNESHMSLQSHCTAQSHHSSRSARSGHRSRTHRTVEEKPLLEIPHHVKQEAEEEKLNINHSSSDNNSSHYACAPIHETKQLNNDIDAQPVNGMVLAFNAPYQRAHELRVELPVNELSAAELSIPEERIYENAHKIMQHERPVYTNLEELRKQAAVKHSPKSPEPPPDEYELPVYENLFSLNEYDTLKKQKHHVNKGLPLVHSGGVNSGSQGDAGTQHDSSL